MSVPIWFTLMRMLLAMPSSMPRCSRSVLVTNRSSPTSCTLSPSRSVSSFQPSQSSSLQPSSIEQIGYFSTQPASRSTMPAESSCLAVDRVLAGLGVVELGGRDVQGDPHLLARLVAGLLGRFEDQVDRLGVVGQIGGETAFVADGGVELLVVQHLLEVVEDLAAAAEGVAERVEAQRHDHELLHVDRVVGVLAAVDDVHHRRGQQPGVRAAEVAVERQADSTWPRRGPRPARRRGSRSRRVPSCSACRRARMSIAVDADLVQRVHADQLVGDLLVDVVDGLGDALAEEQLLVAVAQLPGFVDAGAGAAGDGGPADRAVVERDIDFDGRIAAAIENLAAVDVNNHAHDKGLSIAWGRNRVLNRSF